MNISHNLLEEIRSGAFKYCENMTVLDLSHNRLKRIASDAFDKTSYTTELRLMYNQVGNGCIYHESKLYKCTTI